MLRQVALGTVITSDGYVLTKGSEVLGYSMVTVKVKNGSVQVDMDAKIVGYNEELDLAMLKIDARDLTPVKFADTRPPATQPAVQAPPQPATQPSTQPVSRGRGGINRDNGGPIPTVARIAPSPDGAVRVDVGEWVATTEAGGSYEPELYPKVIGVISTPRRRIERIQGYLGISWLANTYDDTGARVMRVIPGSNAERAGLKNEDIVVSINGVATPTEAKMREVLSSRSRGDLMTLNVVRDGRPLTIRAQLGGDPDPGLEEVEMMVLAGQVNRRSGNFPSVYQHDTVLPPDFCGGPLVDLEGRVIGVNIARAGRTESYAIPADLIKPIIEPLKTGKMPPPSAIAPN